MEGVQIFLGPGSYYSRNAYVVTVVGIITGSTIIADEGWGNLAMRKGNESGAAKRAASLLSANVGVLSSPHTLACDIGSAFNLKGDLTGRPLAEGRGEGLQGQGEERERKGRL